MDSFMRLNRLSIDGLYQDEKGNQISKSGPYITDFQDKFVGEVGHFRKQRYKLVRAYRVEDEDEY